MLPSTLNDLRRSYYDICSSWISSIYRGKGYYFQLHFCKMVINKSNNEKKDPYLTEGAHTNLLHQSISDPKPQVKSMSTPSIVLTTRNWKLLQIPNCAPVFDIDDLLCKNIIARGVKRLGDTLVWVQTSRPRRKWCSCRKWIGCDPP